MQKITIYHVLYNGVMIGETGMKDKTETIIEDYIREYKEEAKEITERLLKIKELFKDVYGPRKRDTPESYKNYIKTNHPELYDEFEKIGPKALKGQHYMGTFIASPEYYAWMATDKEGRTHTYYIQDILMEVKLTPTRDEFTIKEVEIEIP